jgi:hypothetical protein
MKIRDPIMAEYAQSIPYRPWKVPFFILWVNVWALVYHILNHHGDHTGVAYVNALWIGFYGYYLLDILIHNLKVRDIKRTFIP